MKFIQTSLAIILCIAVMSVSFASSFPSYYPKSFQFTGVMKRLDLNKATTVISGSSFTLSSNLVVHTTSKQFATLNALKTGQAVGVSYVRGADNNRMATEIWVLPGSYTFPQL